MEGFEVEWCGKLLFHVERFGGSRDKCVTVIRGIKADKSQQRKNYGVKSLDIGPSRRRRAFRSALLSCFDPFDHRYAILGGRLPVFHVEHLGAGGEEEDAGLGVGDGDWWGGGEFGR
jgi:hypothetical protein